MSSNSSLSKNKKFYKKERLRSKKDFEAVLKSRKPIILQNGYKIYVRENHYGYNRLGIICSKRIGTAVKRNRLKRYIREYFRLNKANMRQGYDIVFVILSDITKETIQNGFIKTELLLK